MNSLERVVLGQEDPEKCHNVFCYSKGFRKWFCHKTFTFLDALWFLIPCPQCPAISLTNNCLHLHQLTLNNSVQASWGWCINFYLVLSFFTDFPRTKESKSSGEYSEWLFIIHQGILNILGYFISNTNVSLINNEERQCKHFELVHLNLAGVFYNKAIKWYQMRMRKSASIKQLA